MEGNRIEALEKERNDLRLQMNQATEELDTLRANYRREWNYGSRSMEVCLQLQRAFCDLFPEIGIASGLSLCLKILAESVEKMWAKSALYKEALQKYGQVEHGKDCTFWAWDSKVHEELGCTCVEGAELKALLNEPDANVDAMLRYAQLGKAILDIPSDDAKYEEAVLALVNSIS